MKLLSPLALSWALQLSVEACLLPHERGGITAGQASQRVPPATREGTGYPIGKGDRFRQGSVLPQGLGTKDRSLESILNIDEVASGLQALAAFPAVRLFDAPHRTYENRTVHGAIIGGGSPRAFIQSGVHARERGGPDNVLYFVADLLAAERDGAGLAYGGQAYTAAQVRTALSAGVVVVPLINPDGVHYDQQTGQCWRKNRNPRSADGADGAAGRSVGVDLNRNYDFLWDPKRYFDPAVRSTMALEDPASELFHGTAPASEPEVRNAQWVMAQHGNLSWFLDLHSFEGDVLFAWGDDETQTADPAQSFANREYDGVRGVKGDGTYAEYMEPGDLASQRGLAERICAAVANAGSVRYTAKRSYAMYATSGTSTDYALGHYYGHKCGASAIKGLGVEFGRGSDFECPFYPTEEQYHESMRQVGVVLMEFLLTAAGPEGAPKHWKC
ncbi:Carboxypeptidase B [Escovopsis weberi]|uniref:Carboxypeptidase B n=1 Tax=Escovopsis weberi TaxID=150374 RepID=A0A0M9VWF0_ESCWE|nr:Carboxypeptidase B [Escovopsis weberi]